MFLKIEAQTIEAGDNAWAVFLLRYPAAFVS